MSKNILKSEWGPYSDETFNYKIYPENLGIVNLIEPSSIDAGTWEIQSKVYYASADRAYSWFASHRSQANRYGDTNYCLATMQKFTRSCMHQHQNWHHEFGNIIDLCGGDAGDKVGQLLATAAEKANEIHYVPVDYSMHMLNRTLFSPEVQSIKKKAAKALNIHPIICDINRHQTHQWLVGNIRKTVRDDKKSLFLLLGQTFPNLKEHVVRDFLDMACTKGDQLVLGLDLLATDRQQRNEQKQHLAKHYELAVKTWLYSCLPRKLAYKNAEQPAAAVKVFHFDAIRPDDLLVRIEEYDAGQELGRVLEMVALSDRVRVAETSPAGIAQQCEVRCHFIKSSRYSLHSLDAFLAAKHFNRIAIVPNESNAYAYLVYEYRPA